MAAARNSLNSELECAICSEQLEQPKYIGPCNHTYCKCCIDQLWVSHGRGRTVPCPHCRKDCPIPSKGAGGLKDNFTVANIIETYRNQPQAAGDLAESKCTLCRNGASCFCKDCDLKLCPKCKRRHDRDPKKRDHGLFTLCPSHGSGLLFFCHPCKQALCGVCKVSDHDKGDHDVTLIHPIIDNLMSRIRAASTELEDVIRTQIRGREKQLSQLCDMVQQNASPAEAKAIAGTEQTIAKKRNEIRRLDDESKNIQKQIIALVKKKDKLGDEKKQLINDVANLEKEKAKIIADVRDILSKSSEEINLRLRSLESRRKEMASKLEQGRALGSSKVTIDTKSIVNLTSISQELIDFVRASREIDSWTVIEEVTRSIRELGLHIGDRGQCLVVMSGDHQIRSGKTDRVFRKLRKVCNVTFPRDRPCKEVYRLEHLHGTGSRLATLGRFQSDDWARTIYFHDDVSSSLTGTITEGVQPACDMAVLSTGEVVVVRREKPPLRVFNLATGAYRDINITHDGKVIDKLGRVEADGSDNMFISATYISATYILVVKSSGNVILSVQLHTSIRGDCYSMAFCSLNKILYIAADDRILRFHWRNDSLKLMSSSSHGVAGFHCCDVCIGSGGEVLVAGWRDVIDRLMGNDDIVIYQVTKGEHDEKFVWKEIQYQDGAKRTSFNRPYICINDNYLWLGYKDKIEKFQLV